MASIGKFMSGPYSATYGGVDVGYVEKPYSYRQNVFLDLIRADYFGQTVVDAVTQGGEIFLMANFLEFTTTIVAMMGVFGANGAWGTIGQAGLLVGGGQTNNPAGAPFRMVAAPNTPAALAVAPAVGPAIINFFSVFPAENNNIEFELGSKHRVVPILFRCFPAIDTNDGGKVKWFNFS